MFTFPDSLPAVGRTLTPLWAFLVAVMVASSSRASGTRAESPCAGGAPGVDANVDKAMADFVTALKRREIAKLLSYFPREGTWSVLATGEAVPAGNAPHKMKYRDIVRKGHPSPEFLDFFFDGDDPFVQFVQRTKGKPWTKREANTFIPPGGWKPTVYVRWRVEGDRFVVDQIASPGS
jgi:hypothetical protein